MTVELVVVAMEDGEEEWEEEEEERSGGGGGWSCSIIAPPGHGVSQIPVIPLSEPQFALSQDKESQPSGTQ